MKKSVKVLYGSLWTVFLTLVVLMIFQGPPEKSTSPDTLSVSGEEAKTNHSTEAPEAEPEPVTVSARFNVSVEGHDGGKNQTQNKNR